LTVVGTESLVDVSGLGLVVKDDVALGATSGRCGPALHDSAQKVKKARPSKARPRNLRVGG